ncbi:hypothetical protein [Oscillibacter sp.]|jgi:hypothetical protein|uniref:hypothetical protein n=1 Tax=Oscillibacter sp. TaxID=1945593 RepID=UPI00216F26D4|nr:hypothetical protein [Oscillibacter sp.]MCI9649357.1 hypothetical protein [Oscillibacter sp.]
MAKQMQGRNRPRVAEAGLPAVSGVPTTPEPPVRRWPHPVDGTEPLQQADSALHFVHCALSYQNELLADIKALLERIAAVQEETEEETE